MIVVLFILGVVLFNRGVASLRASAESCPSDSLYPDKRVAERKMDRVLGWICVAAAVLAAALATVLVLR